MKRKVLWAGITVLMAMSAMAQYSGGEGTAGNPYKISTKEDMEALAAAVDNEAVDATTYFRLTANLEGIETVIGKDAAKPFRGHFDGDGHVLDVTINITTGNYAGVFGYANGATIKNLGVKGSVTCTNAANNAYAGGICGYLLGKGSITGCYNMAEISVSAKSSYAGGICGYSESSPVSNCYNTGGTISSSSSGYTSVSYAGGICGYSGSSSPISNCYNTGGTISSSSDSDSRFDYNSMSGGICGNSQSSPSILNCFVANVTITATGAVSAGRIVGYAYYAATPINNYAHSEMKVNGQTVSDSDNDGKGEMVMDYFRDLDWIETNLKWEVDGWYIPNGDSFPLLKADPGLRLTLSTGSVTYGDTEDITFTVSSKHDDELILYEVLPDDGTVEVMEDAKEIIIKKAGTVTITATQAATDVYAPGKAIATLTIAKAVLTVTADTPDPIIYGANPPEVYTFKYGAFVNNEDEDVLWPNKPAFQCEASNTSDAGDYEIVPVNASLTADNYTFNFVKGKLTIDKRELTVTPKPATRIYGAGDPEFELLYAGFVNDDDEEDITVPPTATTTATATSPVGDNYVITCADGEDTNYTFDCTATGKLTITPAKLTVTALPATSIYGNDLPTYEFEYSGFVNNEDEETPGVITTMPTLTCEVAEGSDAGDYVDAIVPSDAAAGNYTFKYVNGKLTIEQRVLTVTPDDKERVYGEANPETFKLFYEGFAEGEDESVINKLPTAETDAVATSPVGDHYKITCTGGEDTNYTFDCTNIGKLTVTKAPLTVTAKDATRAYGEANPVFTVAYAGWKNGENEGSLSVEPAVACGADEASPAGSYPITFLVGEAANYVFTYVPGTLTVLEVYAVRIPASEGGRVTAEPSSAAAGKVVTLRIAPENGYALTSIGVRWTAAPNTALALSGEGEVRTFVMPAAGVTVSAAFRKTEDRLALEEAVRRLEKASFVVDQEVLNTQEEAFTWLLDTLNVLLEDLNISVPTRNLWIYNFSRAIAGAPSLPAGRDGGFAATVSLSRNGNYGMEYVYGTILATRYVPVGVEAPQVEALTTYVRGGMLYVNGLAVGEAWSVYDISGKRVYQGAAATVPLAVRGVYIVRTETRSVRVVY